MEYQVYYQVGSAWLWYSGPIYNASHAVRVARFLVAKGYKVEIDDGGVVNE